jgi:hypothetical protein
MDALLIKHVQIRWQPPVLSAKIPKDSRIYHYITESDAVYQINIMIIEQPNPENEAVAKVLRRLLRTFANRPGGGRLDEYSQGYDRAMERARYEISVELRKVDSSE